MSRLKSLTLKLDYEEAPEGEAKELISALVGLKRLRQLKLAFLPLHLLAVQLTQLTRLNCLNICQCSLSDLAVNAIVANMLGLQELDLRWNEGLTGSFMPALAKLPLEELSLCGASACDATLSFLSRCQQLLVLNMSSATAVTPEGLAALQEANPALFIGRH